MSNSASIDFGYRPSTYWESPEAVLANIKGEQRRQLVAKLMASGKLASQDERLLAESLTDEERVVLGRMHPAWMGGEYLPDYLAGEVEIARAALKSTTGDVISLRARREDGLIHYRIVDEYESHVQYTPTTSEAPLTLGELVKLIDTARNDSMEYVGLTDALRDNNLVAGGVDPEDLVDFVTISSPFYPQLETHYRAQVQRWLAARKTLSSCGDSSLTQVARTSRVADRTMWVVGALAALVLAMWTAFVGTGGEFLSGAVLIVVLAAAVLINLRTGLILDRLTLPGMVAGLVLSLLVPGRSLLDAAAGLLVGGCAFLICRSYDLI
jgi:hypothetical protein